MQNSPTATAMTSPEASSSDASTASPAQPTTPPERRVSWPSLSFPAINLYSMPRQAIFELNR